MGLWALFLLNLCFYYGYREVQSMGNEVFVIQSSTRKNKDSCPLPARKTSWKYLKIGLAVLLVLGTLSACLAAIYYWDYIEHFKNWG